MNISIAIVVNFDRRMRSRGILMVVNSVCLISNILPLWYVLHRLKQSLEVAYPFLLKKPSNNNDKISNINNKDSNNINKENNNNTLTTTAVENENLEIIPSHDNNTATHITIDATQNPSAASNNNKDKEHKKQSKPKTLKQEEFGLRFSYEKIILTRNSMIACLIFSTLAFVSIPIYLKAGNTKIKMNDPEKYDPAAGLICK